MVKRKSQVEKFREAARAAGADEPEEAFDAKLKELAKTPRDKKGSETEESDEGRAKPGH